MFTFIPTAVWLALVAFLGTIFGAIVSQWGVTRQLRHDAEQRRIDRTMAIRREVYLGAVEGVARLQEYLASFANTGTSQQDREKISRGAFGLINKVHLVGDADTIQAVLTIYEAFSTALIGLGDKQVEIAVLEAESHSAQASHEEAVRRTQQAASAVESAGRAGRGDLLESLVQDLKRSESESQNLLVASSEASKKLNQAKLGLILEMLSQSKTFETASENALLFVRRELGFQTDEEKFRTMMRKSQDSSHKRAEEWVENLKKLINEVQEG